MQGFPFKKILVALVMGLVGYAAVGLLAQEGGFDFANRLGAELLALGIIVLACLGTAFLAGGGGGGLYLGSLDEDRETGTVKWFNVRKGYGFITRDQGDDVFVHFRNIEGQDKRAIAEGQRVSFIVTEGTKGQQANRVTAL